MSWPSDLGRFREYFGRVNFGRIGSPWPNHHDRIRMAWPSELWPTPRILRPSELWRLRAYFGRVNFGRVSFGRLRENLAESPWPIQTILGRVPLAEYNNTWPSTLGRCGQKA